MIQDLCHVPDSNAEVPSKCNLTTRLAIWLTDIRRHPYNRGQLVFSDEDKKLRLGSSDKIMPAISKGLESAKLHCRRLILCSHHFGFGEKGNSQLGVPGRSALIIEVSVKAIQTVPEHHEAPPPAMESVESP